MIDVRNRWVVLFYFFQSQVYGSYGYIIISSNSSSLGFALGSFFDHQEYTVDTYIHTVVYHSTCHSYLVYMYVRNCVRRAYMCMHTKHVCTIKKKFPSISTPKTRKPDNINRRSFIQDQELNLPFPCPPRSTYLSHTSPGYPSQPSPPLQNSVSNRSFFFAIDVVM